MDYIVYKAISPSGKIYIGMTTQAFHARKAQHRYLSKSSKNIFHKALRKYGFDSFLWEILFKTEDLEKLGKMETYFIKLFKSDKREFGYNEKLGGQSGWIYSPEVRRKMSLAKKGKIPKQFKNHINQNKKPIEVFYEGSFIGNYQSITLCADSLNLDQGTISKCLKGQRKGTKGFTFKEALNG